MEDNASAAVAMGGVQVGSDGPAPSTPSQEEPFEQAEPCSPEQIAEALDARLRVNHANTLAYLACLKACVGAARPYREVEEGLLDVPAFGISLQTPHTLLGFLIADGGIERIEAGGAPAGESGSEPFGDADHSPASLDASDAAAALGGADGPSAAGPAEPDSAPADSESVRAFPGDPADSAARPIDYLLRTTPEGEAALARFDAVARFEQLLADEPDGYLDAYLVVLDACAGEGASLKGVESALVGHPALTSPKRVYAGYFISKLEHLGAIAWTDAWHTTPDGERVVAALAAR